MKIYRTEEETAIVYREVLVSIQCNRCGGEVEEERGYHTRDFDLRFTSGLSYGSEGGHKIGWEVEDLCDACVEKLRELLVDNGFTVTAIDDFW